MLNFIIVFSSICKSLRYVQNGDDLSNRAELYFSTVKLYN